MFLPFAIWVLATIFFAYWGPRHWNGNLGNHGRPVIIGETGGFSVMHDGTVPKLDQQALSIMLGI
jgi:hypothetical protein